MLTAHIPFSFNAVFVEFEFGQYDSFHLLIYCSYYTHLICEILLYYFFLLYLFIVRSTSHFLSHSLLSVIFASFILTKRKINVKAQIKFPNKEQKKWTRHVAWWLCAHSIGSSINLKIVKHSFRAAIQLRWIESACHETCNYRILHTRTAAKNWMDYNKKNEKNSWHAVNFLSFVAKCNKCTMALFFISFRKKTFKLGQQSAAAHTYVFVR